MHDLRTLQFVMLSTARVWHFKVQIFINETSRMGKVVVNVICIHVVIVDEHSTIYVTWFEVETNIIPVCWPNIVFRQLRMSEVSWNWKRQGSRFKQAHFSLEVLVLTCIVKPISVDHTDSRGFKQVIRMAE